MPRGFPAGKTYAEEEKTGIGDVEMYSEFNNGTRWRCNRANWRANTSYYIMLYVCKF